jgi:hypothetical protein
MSTVPTYGGDESAKADFVVLQPGFQPGDESDSVARRPS